MGFNRCFISSLSQLLQHITAARVSPPRLPSLASPFEGNMTLYRTFSSKSLPNYVDWRKEGAVTPVKNQGIRRQTCVIFACLGAIEGLKKIRTGRLVSLSVQHILDIMLKQMCKKSKRKWEGKIYLRGTLAETVLNIIFQHGVTTERAHPYLGYASKHELNFSDIHKIDGFNNLPANEDRIKERVAKQPVIAAVRSKMWPMYGWKQNKVYLDPSPRVPCKFTPLYTDHEVLIVGYGEQDGTKYWLIKNSWGRGFGNKGYVKIERGNNAFGIATYTWYPIISHCRKK